MAHKDPMLIITMIKMNILELGNNCQFANSIILFLANFGLAFPLGNHPSFKLGLCDLCA